MRVLLYKKFQYELRACAVCFLIRSPIAASSLAFRERADKSHLNRCFILASAKPVGVGFRSAGCCLLPPAGRPAQLLLLLAPLWPGLLLRGVIRGRKSRNVSNDGKAFFAPLAPRKDCSLTAKLFGPRLCVSQHPSRN